MKNVFFLLSFSGLLFFCPMAIYGQDRVMEDQGRFYIVNKDNKTEITDNVAKMLLNADWMSLSPDKKLLLKMEGKKVSCLDVNRAEDKIIMSFNTEKNFYTQVKWSVDGIYAAFAMKSSVANDYGIAFFIFKSNTRSIEKYRLNMKLSNNASQNSETFTFIDPNTIEYVLAKPEFYHGTELHSKFLHFDYIKPGVNYYAKLYATSQPSDYIYQVIDSHGNQITLPETVQKAAVSPYIFSISPMNDFLIFNFDYKIMNWEIGSKETETLVTLFSDSDGLSDIAYSNDGKKMAFVNINQNRYPKLCKLFVLHLLDGHMVKKLKYDVPAFFICGSRCFAENVFFLNDTTIRYKIHEMADKNPGKYAYIRIDE